MNKQHVLVSEDTIEKFEKTLASYVERGYLLIPETFAVTAIGSAIFRDRTYSILLKEGSRVIISHYPDITQTEEVK